jgi:2-keto-4-pentenoate hydratase/2-oxohepta-3-ene-1,7-dioic acid hydratase in catechol pathway
MQKTLTDDMIFDVPTLIAILSEVMTLEPGDVIITGTPSGVGVARTPQVFLQPGDVCEVDIEGIGVLRNSVVQEAP